MKNHNKKFIGKRSLGQNFLTSKWVVKTIVETGEVTKKDTVLEVGPGKGILTKELLLKAKTVIAFEKDDALYKTLNKTFASEIAEKKLILINDDIFNFKKYKEALPLQEKNLKIIANIPYNITGKLIPFFFQLTPLPQIIVLMVQKEVAHRIVARDGKESILSISVKVFSTPQYIKRVSASLFSPKPKVDSAIILFKNISVEYFKRINEQTFFALVKKGFSQKRKFLKNNLLIKESVLSNCGVAPTARAEELSVLNWVCLTKNIIKYEN